MVLYKGFNIPPTCELEESNAQSSGKRERFGEASEWFSDDLVCHVSLSYQNHSLPN
jgi:hypothetical protein